MNPVIRIISAALVSLVTLSWVHQSEAAEYTYDSLGRLITVVEADGSTAQYTYDANGNILSISRSSGSPSIRIDSFSPGTGTTATVVTIRGVGFSATPSQNTVTFNGVAATVTSASAIQLVVAVPATATTGSIAVSSPSGTAVSSTPFTISSVRISGFTPTRGAANTVVTISGVGFDPDLLDNTVKFNGVVATVISANATELQVVVPNGATSGRISVTTPVDVGVSAGDFFVPMTGYAAADIETTARLTPGSTGLVHTVSVANKIGVVVFDGVQGQRITLVLSNTSMGGRYHLYAPDGTLITWELFATTSGVVDMPPLPSTGTYTLYFEPWSQRAGSTTVRIATDFVGTITPDGTPLPLSLAIGQNAEVTFTAVAGQIYHLQLTPYVTIPSGGNVRAWFLKPDGTVLLGCEIWNIHGGNCRFTSQVNGTLHLRLDAAGGYAANFEAVLTADASGELQSGVPQNLSLLKTQNATYTYVAAAGDNLTVNLEDINVPTPTNKTIALSLLHPTGYVVNYTLHTVGPSATMNYFNLTAGTYRIWIRPYDPNASATMQVTAVNNAPILLTANGLSTPVTTLVRGQQPVLQFDGTTGEELSIGITEMVPTPSSVNSTSFTLWRPLGGQQAFFWSYGNSNPGDSVGFGVLPQTGRYSLIAAPSGQATLTFKATLSHPATDTLVVGSTVNASMPSPGQFGKYTFTAAANDTFALHASSITTTPSGRTVWFSVQNSSGATVGTVSTVGPETTLNLPYLAAGTYNVWVNTNSAAPISMNLKLVAGVTGTLAWNTPTTFSTTVPGQIGYFKFNGTGGQLADLGVTGLPSGSSTSSHVSVQVYRPTWQSYRYLVAYNWQNPGEKTHFGPLPSTGVYDIIVTPGEYKPATYTLTASERVTGTLIAGSPHSLAMTVPGQVGELTFTQAAMQSRTIDFTSIVTSPSGKAVWVGVTNSAGAMVASSTSSAPTISLNLPSLPAGTYSVFAAPAYAAPATMQVTLQ